MSIIVLFFSLTFGDIPDLQEDVAVILISLPVKVYAYIHIYIHTHIGVHICIKNVINVIRSKMHTYSSCMHS